MIFNQSMHQNNKKKCLYADFIHMIAFTLLYVFCDLYFDRDFFFGKSDRRELEVGTGYRNRI